MLRAMVMAVNPEMKERTIKGDRCEPAKDPLMIKSVFFLKHKDGKLCMVELTSNEWDSLFL